MNIDAQAKLSKKPFSLRRRMLFTLVPVLAFALLFLAYALERSFAESSEASLRTQLNLQLRLLLADAEIVDGGIAIPELTGVPRLNQPESDLFAYALDANGEIVWRSLSLRSGLTDIDAGAFSFAQTIATRARGSIYYDRHQHWYIAAMRVAFGLESIDASDAGELANNKPIATATTPASAATSSAITFVVMDSGAALALQQKIFRATLWRWLLIAMAVLTSVQLLLLFWSFKPLGQLVEEVGRVERGEQALFSNQYPSEIEPLTDNLNRFVEHERKQRERYKHNLADLAHSLKTPLAALRASIETDTHDVSLLEQVDRMDQIVAHQLNRSKVYNAHTLRNQHCDLAQVLDKLLPVLQKVYAQRNIQLQNTLPASLVVAMAADDAMDLLGNILENAFKYGNHRVRVSGRAKVGGGSNLCELIVEDDGAGIAPELFERVLARGARLDEQQSGQGIGLAVAADIIEAYSGQMALQRSELGGARLVLNLPR